MNPDRATLNFLNSFPEKARIRGEALQEDGAVTQIFGNHLFIQGRVEDPTGTFRTSLRLQGNRWFGSCTAEDEIIAGHLYVCDHDGAHATRRRPSGEPE